MTTIEAKYQEKCATPSDIYQHLPTLRKYAEQCRHVTEMGVRTIVSTWAFLAAKPEHGVLSIDYIHPVRHGGNLDEVLELAILERVIFDFVEADTRTVEISPTDLLFIDTWHTCEQLKIELARHASKAGKFIILHDTETYGLQDESPGTGHGLRPALNDFLADGEGLNWKIKEIFTNCNGLTVLERRT